MTSPPQPICTPCIQVCAIDLDSGLCLGCFRTLQEIGEWSRLADFQRAQIMGTLEARRATIDPAKLTPLTPPATFPG